MVDYMQLSYHARFFFSLQYYVFAFSPSFKTFRQIFFCFNWKDNTAHYFTLLNNETLLSNFVWRWKLVEDILEPVLDCD